MGKIDEKKIKVLHLIGAIGSGGIESFLISMHKSIDRNEIESTFFLWSSQDERFYDNNYLDKLGIRLAYGQVEKGCKVKRFVEKVYSLYGYVKKEGQSYDIIHIHGSDSTMYIFGAVAKIAGIRKVILHAHTSFSFGHKTIRFLTIFPLKLLFSKYIDAFISCSSSAGKHIFPTKDDRCYILHNGIDTDKFAFDVRKRISIRNSWGLDKAFVVGHIGRLSREKNHKYILKVFKKILNVIPNAHLIIVGKGKEKENIVRMINMMDLKDYVTLLNPTQRIEEVMMGMDVMIFPSLWEGLPLVPIEAQACSLPVYVSDRVVKDIGITKYITFLSINEKPLLWANKIINDKDKYERKDNTRIIKEKEFDITVAAKGLLKIYRYVTGGIKE